MKRECSELQVAFWVEPVNVPHTGVLICGHPSRLLMVIALERLLMAGNCHRPQGQNFSLCAHVQNEKSNLWLLFGRSAASLLLW